MDPTVGQCLFRDDPWVVEERVEHILFVLFRYSIEGWAFQSPSFSSSWQVVDHCVVI